jgi:8-oxo-dGTP pyrophosphatase MutT (NUDIX family)
MTEIEVFAAGGVVVNEHGRLLVVHRPRYDDWSFPKGKLDPGETLQECALREVLEETGCVCRLGRSLTAIRYVDHKGRHKEVSYWLMVPESTDFVPNDEVDEIRWILPDQATLLLSYERDREVLAAVH